MLFGSDNQVGASRQVLDALVAANDGHVHSYGNDPHSERAVQALREVFETDLQAFFVSTGTAANSLALACLAQPWEMILCHHHAHIVNDESTAPEFFTNGARVVGISGRDGKLLPRHLEEFFRSAGTEFPHNSRASALSITQASENGLVYKPDELASLCALAHEQKMKVQMDGARFANALVHIGCTPAELSWKAGIDVLSLGATKNGALAAEVVIFFDKTLADTFIYRRKRSGHLLSKNRFAGAQLAAWLHDDHWRKLARHANEKAKTLAMQLQTLNGARLTWPVEANEVFVVLPKSTIDRLRKAGSEFYDWPLAGLPTGTLLSDAESYVRLVTTFKTQDAEIDAFIRAAKTN